VRLRVEHYPVTMTSETKKPGFLTGFGMGVRLLGRGFRLWVTSPRLMLIGAIPGLVTLVIVVAAAVALALNLENISTFLTGFAERWDEVYRTGIRLLVMAALVGAGLLIFVYSFTAITLLIGQPFFEKISERVELSLGGVPQEAESPLLASIARGIGESLRILLVTLAIGLGLFALGFVPLIGTVLAWILGAVTGGWFLALELSTPAFERRGLSPQQRRAALGARRSTTLGFGIAVFVLFLVPLGALVTMPAAAAGATLLARRSLGETDRLPTTAVPRSPQA
jgi:CysZ protein